MNKKKAGIEKREMKGMERECESKKENVCLCAYERERQRDRERGV